jgi:hypothetical protein
VRYTFRTPIIGLRFLANPADIFPETDGRDCARIYILRTLVAQSRFNLNSFSPKELITWRQQKSVIR